MKDVDFQKLTKIAKTFYHWGVKGAFNRDYRVLGTKRDDQYEIGNLVTLNKPNFFDVSNPMLRFLDNGLGIVGIPPTGGGTAQQAGFRNQVAVAFTPLIDVQCDNSMSPRMITLAVSPPELVFNPAANPTLFDNCDIKCRVEWGVKGGRHLADFDCRHGAQVTIFGDWIRVTGMYAASSDRDDSPQSADPSNFPDVTLAAAISYARNENFARPTWTAKTQVTDGGVADFQIPPFATDVTVYATSDTQNPVAVDIQFFCGTTLVVAAITQPANSFPKYRIPHISTLMQLNNNFAGSDAILVAVFDLAL